MSITSKHQQGAPETVQWQSNSFLVDNVNDFIEEAQLYEGVVVTATGDGSVNLRGCGKYSIPEFYYDYGGDESSLDFMEAIKSHISEGSMAVIHEISTYKSGEMFGYSVAVSKRGFVQICTDEIYKIAEEHLELKPTWK